MTDKIVRCKDCDHRDPYYMYREECARARGWNEAKDMMFPKEAEERRKKKHPFYKQIKEGELKSS